MRVIVCENYDEMSKSEVTALAYVMIKRLLVPGNPDINFKK